MEEQLTHLLIELILCLPSAQFQTSRGTRSPLASAAASFGFVSTSSADQVSSNPAGRGALPSGRMTDFALMAVYHKSSGTGVYVLKRISGTCMLRRSDSTRPAARSSGHCEDRSKAPGSEKEHLETQERSE